MRAALTPQQKGGPCPAEPPLLRSLLEHNWCLPVTIVAAPSMRHHRDAALDKVFVSSYLKLCQVLGVDLCISHDAAWQLLMRWYERRLLMLSCTLRAMHSWLSYQETWCQVSETSIVFEAGSSKSALQTKPSMQCFAIICTRRLPISRYGPMLSTLASHAVPHAIVLGNHDSEGLLERSQVRALLPKLPSRSCKCTRLCPLQNRLLQSVHSLVLRSCYLSNAFT